MRINQTRYLAVSVAALLVFFWLALQAVLAKTPTADEGMHMLRGQVLRLTDELTLQGQHTPLSHWLIGAFYFAEDSIPLVTELPSWPAQSPPDLVQEFLWSGGAQVARLLFLARLPILFASLLLGAVIGRWAGMLTGFTGTTIALVLYAFSPNLLASASLSTTDLVATAAYVGAAFAVWFYWRRPSRMRWVLTGLALGLAISSKLTGLLTLPVALVLCYIESFRPKVGRANKVPWWRPGLVWLSWLPLAGLVLWAVYRFEVGPVAGLSFPLPAATFLSNFVEVQDHIERGHYSFLLGQRSNQGWPAYFALAYVYKTPVVAFVMLIVALVYITWQRLWVKVTALWLPAGALFLAASVSRLNIGIRHILPVIPFLCLLIAMSGPMWRRRRESRWVMLALLAIYALGTFRQSPHFLAYFSELAGGSDQGYRYLGDSNIDWGQDLRLLAEYADAYDGGPFYASYFGSGDPGYYGLEAPPLFDELGIPVGFAPANPEPGRYAISVNHLQGATPAEPDLFDWFRNQEPLDNLGYSVLIYNVLEQRDGNWIAHCIDPLPFLDEQMAERYVDRDSLRHLYFDCRQSWVIPAGAQPGWFVLPLDFDPARIDPALAGHLELVFTNNAAGYRIYFWPALPAAVQRLGWHSAQYKAADGNPVRPPLTSGQLADWAGGYVNGSTWASVWQAQTATEAPVSVLMHLYADTGVPPSVADGLGFAASHWQPGDVIVQYHDFEEASGKFLETALYDFTTGERLPFIVDGATESAVRILP